MLRGLGPERLGFECHQTVGRGVFVLCWLAWRQAHPVPEYAAMSWFGSAKPIRLVDMGGGTGDKAVCSVAAFGFI